MDRSYNEFHKNSRVQRRPVKKNNFTYRLIIEEVGKILRGLKKGRTKVLDYGCGVGTVAFYLASTGSEVTGVDISPLSIELCKRSAKKMDLGDSVRFEIDNDFWKKHKNINSKFDLVICLEVIEHVRDDTGLLKKLTKVLNKGGYLFLTTPSKNAPLFRMGVAKSFDKRVGHLRRYNEQTLVDIVERSGMKVERVCKMEGVLRNSLFLIPQLGFFVRFLRGLLSDVVTLVDGVLVSIFGESCLFVVARKT